MLFPKVEDFRRQDARQTMFSGKINVVADFLFLTLTGILFELVLGLSPVFDIAGGVSMVLAMGWLTLVTLRMETAV